MFSPEHFGFPYPLFVTTLHMFVQFVLAALLRVIWPERFRPERSPTREDYGWVFATLFSWVGFFEGLRGKFGVG
jgi:hypothetical protein